MTLNTENASFTADLWFITRMSFPDMPLRWALDWSMQRIRGWGSLKLCSLIYQLRNTWFRKIYAFLWITFIFTGITAAGWRWHLSYINDRWHVFWHWWKIRKITKVGNWYSNLHPEYMLTTLQSDLSMFDKNISVINITYYEPNKNGWSIFHFACSYVQIRKSRGTSEHIWSHCMSYLD